MNNEEGTPVDPGGAPAQPPADQASPTEQAYGPAMTPPDPAAGAQPPLESTESGQSWPEHGYTQPEPPNAYSASPQGIEYAPADPQNDYDYGPHYAPQSAQAGGSRSNSVALAVTLSLLGALLVSAIAGLAGGYFGAQLAGPGSQTIRVPERVQIVPPKTPEVAVAAAAAALPSVVNIDVASGKSSSSDGALPEDHPDVPITGNGSGVAYKSDGEGGTYIITNNHVVDGATRIAVREPNGDRFDGTLVGQDAETDIAVVRIEDKLPTLDVADSEDLNVGQSVVAIGSPFGLAHSVTVGVISALGRSLPDFGVAAPGTYPLIDVIQTDAAINPGNSGGALVDREGKLVGINTAIYSDTGASGGIGFAVPSNTAVRVADTLIEGGTVETPFLGIVGQTVTSQVVESEGLSVDEGALVEEITEGSGAAEGGIRPGDVIVSVGGERTRTMDDLILQVRRQDVGATVAIEVVRDDETVELEITVGAKPEGLEPPAAPPEEEAPSD
jgi:putative serine protease PepD